MPANDLSAHSGRSGVEDPSWESLCWHPKRAKGSNLAFALLGLPESTRNDLFLFHHFCRAVDDIADNPKLTTEEKQSRLERWRVALAGSDTLPPALREMLERTQLDRSLLMAVIEGVWSDCSPMVRIRSETELQKYAWHVASAVGLACAWLFGSRSEEGKIYAEQLGTALQYTNILRDVAEDLGMNRIYLPEEDFQNAGISSEMLRSHPTHPKIKQVIATHSKRCSNAFEKVAGGPPGTEKRIFQPARAMAGMYQHLLKSMQNDGLGVMQKRYSVSKPMKVLCLFQSFLP
jgi:phytoene/squalene synthetase